MDYTNNHQKILASVKQQGVVLVTALIFLTMMTLLGITMMGTNTLEERMAGNIQDMNRSFQTAETGLALAFTDSSSFAGTGTSFLYNSNNNNVGDYNATVAYTVTYQGETSLGHQELGKADEAGKLSYNFYNLDVDATTVGGSPTTLGAGARVVGAKK